MSYIECTHVFLDSDFSVASNIYSIQNSYLCGPNSQAGGHCYTVYCEIEGWGSV